MALQLQAPSLECTLVGPEPAKAIPQLLSTLGAWGCCQLLQLIVRGLRLWGPVPKAALAPVGADSCPGLRVLVLISEGKKERSLGPSVQCRAAASHRALPGHTSPGSVPVHGTASM